MTCSIGLRSGEQAGRQKSFAPAARMAYQLRNLVERCFNKLKDARRVTARHDKTAESFPGSTDITSIRFRRRYLSTRARPRRNTVMAIQAHTVKTHREANLA